MELVYFCAGLIAGVMGYPLFDTLRDCYGKNQRRKPRFPKMAPPDWKNEEQDR